jgi:vacuolar-type H+-ATPase subunit H
VRAQGTDGERETLEQLRGDEATLEQEIRSAQAESAALLDRACTEAARLVAEARAAAGQEVARLRAEEQHALEAELVATRAGAELDGTSARRAAAERGPRALAAIIDAVLGRVP